MMKMIICKIGAGKWKMLNLADGCTGIRAKSVKPKSIERRAWSVKRRPINFQHIIQKN